MKKKSVVQWVASRKIRWPASTYTSIVGLFFRYCFTSICVCVTFSICFLGFGHALFEWVVWETEPRKKPGTLVKWITMTVLFELKQLGLKNYDHYLFHNVNSTLSADLRLKRNFYSHIYNHNETFIANKMT